MRRSLATFGRLGANFAGGEEARLESQQETLKKGLADRAVTFTPDQLQEPLEISCFDRWKGIKAQRIKDKKELCQSRAFRAGACGTINSVLVTSYDFWLKLSSSGVWTRQARNREDHRSKWRCFAPAGPSDQGCPPEAYNVLQRWFRSFSAWCHLKRYDEWLCHICMMIHSALPRFPNFRSRTNSIWRWCARCHCTPESPPKAFARAQWG